MTDREEESSLVAAAQAGDRRAIERLVERLQDAVYRFGRRICTGEADARDVVQDTFVTAIDKIGDFRGESSFTRWVYAIARSHCARRRRRSALSPLADGDADDTTTRVVDPSPLPDDLLARMQLSDAVEAAVERLEPIYREVLVLRDVEGLSAAEVGDILGISVDAVKSRLHRARMTLRDRLGSLVSPTETPPASSRGTCPDIAEVFSRFLEGELTGDACARMQDHIESCPGCNCKCAHLKKVLGACRQAGNAPAPPEVRAQVGEAVARMLANKGRAARPA